MPNNGTNVTTTAKDQKQAVVIPLTAAAITAPIATGLAARIDGVVAELTAAQRPSLTVLTTLQQAVERCGQHVYQAPICLNLYGISVDLYRRTYQEFMDIVKRHIKSAGMSEDCFNCTVTFFDSSDNKPFVQIDMSFKVNVIKKLIDILNSEDFDKFKDSIKEVVLEQLNVVYSQSLFEYPYSNHVEKDLDKVDSLLNVVHQKFIRLQVATKAEIGKVLSLSPAMIIILNAFLLKVIAKQTAENKLATNIATSRDAKIATITPQTAMVTSAAPVVNNDSLKKLLNNLPALFAQIKFPGKPGVFEKFRPCMSLPDSTAVSTDQKAGTVTLHIQYDEIETVKATLETIKALSAKSPLAAKLADQMLQSFAAVNLKSMHVITITAAESSIFSAVCGQLINKTAIVMFVSQDSIIYLVTAQQVVELRKICNKLLTADEKLRTALLGGDVKTMFAPLPATAVTGTAATPVASSSAPQVPSSSMPHYSV